MPNTASAKKRLRQDKARSAHNRSIKTAVKTKVKTVTKALESGDVAAAEAAYPVAAKHLDKAASKNIIHNNTAARKKSRLQKAIVKAKKG
jgi:small subunit ribosomal protein S20